MEIKVSHTNKTVEIWLTRAEREQEDVKKQLNTLYNEFGKKKYTVLVFMPGKENLYDNTLDMLKWNRKCSEKKKMPKKTRSAMCL